MSLSRKSPGRRRIKLEKMQNEKALQVTFSKRRTGAFKKACELCTLTGANVALIAFSPSGKAFSFGYPDVQSNMSKVLVNGNLHMPINDGLQQMIQAQHDSDGRNLNLEIMKYEAILANEKNQAKELQLQKTKGKMLNWYPTPTEELSLDELIDLQRFLGNFEKEFLEAKNKAEMQVHGSSFPKNHTDIPGSSSNPSLPLGSNEFPMGYMHPRVCDPNFFLQDPYDTTSFVTDHMNNYPMDLDSYETEFGNHASNDPVGHASNDPIGLQVTQHPLPPEYNLTDLVDHFSNDMTYDWLSKQISKNTNSNATSLEVSHAPSTTQFDQMDQVPHAPYSHTTGVPFQLRMYTGSETRNSYPFSLLRTGLSTSSVPRMYPGESSNSYPFGFPQIEFTNTGGSGIYPGETSNSYPFGLPPTEFSTGGGPGVYPTKNGSAYIFGLPPTGFSTAEGLGTDMYPGSLNKGTRPGQL